MAKLTKEEWLEALEIWEQNHPGENRIRTCEKVTLKNGKVLNLGKKVSKMKSKTQQLSEEDKKRWGKYLKKEYVTMTDADRLEALEIWEQNHPGENRIRTCEKVTLKNGKVLNFGKKVSSMKLNPQQLSEEDKKRWGKYLKKEKLYRTETEYREAYEMWLRQNPDTPYMPRDVSIVISNGKNIAIRNRLTNIRKKPSMLSEEEREYWIKKGIFENDEMSYRKHQEMLLLKYWRNIPLNYNKQPMRKIQFEMETRQAYSIFKSENKDKVLPINDKKHNPKVEIAEGKEVNLVSRLASLRKNYNNLSKNEREFWEYQGIFDNINKNNYKRYQEESLESIFKSQTLLSCEYEEKAYWVVKCLQETRKKQIITEPIPEQKSTSISKQEIRNQVLKYHEIFPNETADQLIDRVVAESKCSKLLASSWIYERYGYHIPGILKSLNLNAASILKKMSEEIMPLEEAICDDIFLKNNEIPRYEWVEVPLQYLKMQLNGDETPYQTRQLADSLAQTYHLSKEELRILKNCLCEYNVTMREYQKMEVGLELTQEKKLEKIEKYKLSGEEVEEAFFMPLELYSEYLSGEEKERHNRKQLLREYVIDWNFYSDNEKKHIIKKEQMTKEEVYHVNNARMQIDELVALTTTKEKIVTKKK